MIQAVIKILLWETDRRIEENSNAVYRYNLYGTVNKYGHDGMIWTNNWRKDITQGLGSAVNDIGLE